MLNEEHIKQVEKDAHRAGFLEAIQAYSIWKDGIQYIGCMDRTIPEVMKSYDEDHK